VNYFSSDPRPAAQNFTKEYKALYGADPNQFAALAYDAAGLLVAASRRWAPKAAPRCAKACWVSRGMKAPPADLLRRGTGPGQAAGANHDQGWAVGAV